MYFFQTYFKPNTSAHKALSSIAGLGHKMATQTCDLLGISKKIPLKALSPPQIAKLSHVVHQNILVEEELRVLVRERIKRLTSISCYRGFRHLEGLPCRGQRTHTNARISRKKRVEAQIRSKGKRSQ